MDDKRFVQCEIEYGFANTTNIKKIDGIYDMQEEKTYRIEQIVDKLKTYNEQLGEQQATIEQLRKSQDVKEFSALFNQSIALKREIKDLKKENKQLHYKIIELQDKLGMSEKVIYDD